LTSIRQAQWKCTYLQPGDPGLTPDVGMKDGHSFTKTLIQTLDLRIYLE